jgi:lambda repressor-like predicted transcriptional regulator
MSARKGQKPNRGKQVTVAEFRRMWLDLSISQGEIGKRLGITGQAALCRALSRGLAPRPSKRPWTRKIDHIRIARLYTSGLSIAAIAKVTGHSRNAIQNALQMQGVAMRPVGKPAPVQVNRLLAEAMAASARETRAAMRDAEMVDGDPRRRAA